MEEVFNVIGGQKARSSNGKSLENFDPSCGESFSFFPDSTSQDAEEAIAAAQEAFPSWAERSAESRSEVLRKVAGLLSQRQEEFSRLETQDVGKPITMSRTVDIPRCVQNFQFFADALTQTSERFYDMGSQGFNYTLRSPLGVVVTISPWNLPLYLLTWKVAPALAAGNAVVAKPSEMTPMTASLLAEVMEEAGVPPGVFNLLHGRGDQLGKTLCTDSRVKGISFTGSTATGRAINQTAATHFKKVSLEMGGKNASIVFSDADMGKAIPGILRSAFANQGQVCLCGSRILVQKSIYPEFKKKLVEAMKSLYPGDPMQETTTQGAVVSLAHFNKITQYLEKARVLGGHFIAGGKPAQLSGKLAQGWFIEPSLVEGLDPECEINQEEIFGPVASLIPFESKEEALAIANSTRYGLCASVFTENLGLAHQLAQKLDVGMVWLNGWALRDLRTPFGGVKDSGLGREGGTHSLAFFSEPKNICWVSG